MGKLRIIAFCLLLSAALALPVSAADSLVQKVKDDNGEWLKFVKPIVVENNGMKFSILGVGHIKAEDGGSEDDSLRVMAAWDAEDWGLTQWSAQDDKGNGIDSLGTSGSTSTMIDGVESSFASFDLQLPPADTTSLKSVNVTLQKVFSSKDRTHGPFTAAQIKAPYKIADKVAVQLLDWNLVTYPAHKLGWVFDDEQDKHADERYKPNNTNKYLRLRFLCIDGTTGDSSSVPFNAVAYDAKGREISFSGNGSGSASSKGSFGSPYLGLQAVLLNETRKKSTGASSGAMIARIDPFGPAAKAGLKKGDVLTRWGNINIKGEAETSSLDAFSKPSAPVKVSILRSGKARSVTITPVADPNFSVSDSKVQQGWSQMKSLFPSQDAWFYQIFSFVSYDPVGTDVKPAKIELKTNEPQQAGETREFTFQDVPIPAEFWQ